MSDGLNMADMFSKMADMQKKMAEAQTALGTKTVSAEAGGGMVKVTANGLQRITSISIEKEVVDPSDVELLEDLVMAGVKKALEEAANIAKQEMAKSAGSMLPPGMDLGKFGL